jgi:hypothetical protein
MKSLAGKILAALLLVAYVWALFGFRLHECSLDHSVEVLSLLAGDTCEEVHHHHCTDAAHCGHHHHHCSEDHDARQPSAGVQISEADCCTNSLHILSDEQIVTDDDGVAGSVASAAFVLAPGYIAAAPVQCVSRVSYAPCALAGNGRTMLALYSVMRA